MEALHSISKKGFSSKNERGAKDAHLEEPLLNGNSSNSGNVVESTNLKVGAKSVTPYASGSFFSLLTFSWMSPLIATGYKKQLDLEDIPQLASPDSVKSVFPIFSCILESDRVRSNKTSTLRLARALILTTWKDIAITAFLAVSYTLASYVGPYLINSFVHYLNGRRDFNNEGYLLVSAFFIANIVNCLARRHWFLKMQQVALRARSAVIQMIYHKGMTLSCQSKQGSSSGEIINLVAVDVDRIYECSWFMHDPWLMIVEVGLAVAVLYTNLGLASIAALFATVMAMLANVPLGNLEKKFQKELMKSKDRRMKLTSETLRSMRILKLQAWEMKFLSRIVDLRKDEAGWLQKYMYARAVSTTVFWNAYTFVAVVTFCTCSLVGIPLESGNVLSAIATFRILQGPINRLPSTVSMLAQVKVSLDRISTFLCLSDLDFNAVEKLPSASLCSAVEIVDGNFSWDVSSLNTTLKDINLMVSRGMKVAVCGTVGSGKSTLLSCILGEVPKMSGRVKICGRKAYVAQSPWIQSGKIVDNILFGKEMDKEKYEKVLQACALKDDLEILPYGDQTVIGERGINLSGGQKQRVQIARALYRDADIYLFDDPFSAVDAHTGSHLFKECLMGLLISKTVIFVTHQVEFLHNADLILVMKDGKITQAGKFSDILDLGTDFMELVGAHNEGLSAIGTIGVGPISGRTSVNEEDGVTGTSKMVSSKESRDGQCSKSVEVSGQKGQLVQEEERVKGSVGFSIYWKYITTAYGGALVPFLLLSQILFQLLQIGSNYWMAWASPVSKSSVPPVSDSTLILVYVSLAFGSSFCILSRALLLVIAGYKTATQLFLKMHFCIFRAPMSFFDSTPSGRILNRASSDQSTLDLGIPYVLGAFAFSIIQLLAVIAVMSQVAWLVFLVFIPVIAFCIWLQQYYIPSARELSRLSAVSKAPIIQHFAETISGSTTIRGFDQESRFQGTNMELVDAYSRPRFHASAAREWLCFRLDMLSSFTFAVFLIFLISMPEGMIVPSLAGLAVTYGLNLNTQQASIILSLSNLENRMISVERILQHLSIPSEAPLVEESNRPSRHWPSDGELDIQNLQVRYASHMPLVLRGLTCTFPGGMKTGIVGRTGCGKSTLVQTIFRIVEPAGGKVLIDGINILSVGLHDLRSRLSIIPQDPTMFQGTVRNNIDPLEEYSDEQIWEALEKCQLADEVRKKETKLESIVNENGENWSVGQRQLVCLGRVLLKKSKVLVLDEATASVDTVTDNMIQQTLRQQFSHTTVITVAHRITSVLDSDQVLVLDCGLVQEFGSPSKLLENKSSSFSKLVAEYAARSSHGLEL